MEIKYLKEELGALRGLQHLQQLIYLTALRPYVDYKTGIVGLKRGISYQSISEELYIEPHSGIRSGSPSREQIRRALQGLIKAGLITSINHDYKLVFKCCLLTRDESVQNNPVTNPTEDPAQANQENVTDLSGNYTQNTQKAAPPKMPQPDTPLKNINILFFLKGEFEKFWQAYPVKRSRQSAWQIFQTLAPDEELLQTILAALKQQKQAHFEAEKYKEWLPNWKNPANWLREKCWEDEVKIEKPLGKNHANNKTKLSKLTGSELLWESCRGAFDDDQQDIGF